MFAQKSIIQFAKSPVLGQVKTRLQTQLSAEEALAVHCELTQLTFNTLLETDVDLIRLQVSGPIQDPFFDFVRHNIRAELQPQVEGNLGTKMCSALNQALQTSQAAVLVGSDCPVLSVALFEKAFEALLSNKEHSDFVFSPAEDGGYVLIGSKVTVPDNLFSGVEWGSEQALRQSLACIKKIGLTATILTTLWDIDHPADLARWRALSKP